MPRVPSYDNFTVAPNTTPQVQIRAPDMPDVAGQQAQQLGQNLSRAGGQLSRIALAEADQANQVRVNDAMNKAMQAKLRLTYDPNEGFVHLKGDAALTRPDNKALDTEYSEKLQKQLEEIASGLGNDAQKQTFLQQAGQMSMQFQGSITSHVAREYGEYQVSVQEGTIATARDQMALAWGDAGAVTQSSEAIKAAVAEQGRLRGLSAQQVEANMVAALSPGHSAVIASAVDAGKLDYARQYMEQVKGELTPQARLQVTKVLDAGDFETRTQNAADEIVSKYGANTAEALSEVRSKFSGKEEDAIVQRIKAIDSERVALRERAQKDAADKAWQFVAQGRTPPPSLMSALDGRDAVAIRKSLSDGPARKTDPNIYYALSLAAAGDPSFKEEDLRRYVDKLTPGDFKHFVDLQAKSRKPGEAEQVATATQQMGALAQSLGMKDEQKGVFFMEANKALFAAQQEKGRALDQTERQKVLDGLVVKGEITNSWFNDSARRFEARAKGREQDFTPQFTDADRNKATAALQRQGIKAPTKQQIEATIRAAYGIQ
jgi:hypothetical protein